ncbi:MAG: PD-(D/E)XK nuclease superfamily protein [Dehalococcoidia bacterium]
MPGQARATASPGRDLVAQVAELAVRLGLSVRTEVRVGRRLWGAVRRIDVVLTDPATRRTLGLECKFQGGAGSAEEKVPATVNDIAAWPIPGIVVIGGAGFSANMRQFLISTGKAVDVEDLEDWLRLYFGLDDAVGLPPAPPPCSTATRRGNAGVGAGQRGMAVRR